MTALILMLTLLAVSLAMQVALTYLASRWMRVENATWGRAALIVILLTAGGLALNVRMRAWLDGDQFPLGPALVTIVIACGSFYALYRIVYHASFRQFLGFLGMHIVASGAALGMAYGCKTFVVEGFVVPTNGMSPTILGRHVITVCPQCGGSMIHSVPEPPPAPFPIPPKPDTYGACAQCWEYMVGLKVDRNAKPIDGDRVLINKLDDDVGRWDVVVFRYPQDPQTLFVQRIVGLPGEEIVLGDDGVPIIDGKRIEPPASLLKLRYSARPAENNQELFSDYDDDPLLGDKRKPMRLGPDEYFLLGDCTHRSLDSRYWGPVKREAIIAPVSLTYWPPERWRVFE